MFTKSKLQVILCLGYIASFLSSHAAAQGVSEGIYRNESDFHAGRLSHTNTNHKKYRIKSNEVFYKPYIQVKADDSAFTFYKDSIYGYRDEDGTVYRFFENNRYEILNPGERVVLYGVKYHDQKGGMPRIQYYFSKNDQAPVQELTIRNLERVFKENTTFCEWLDAQRCNGTDLAVYDPSSKQFTLNKVLKNTFAK